MSNCKCRAELEEKLKALFQQRNPQATNPKVALQGYGLTLGKSTVQVMGYMPIEIKADYPLKNGGVKNRKTTQSMFFSFCRFCGKSTADEKQAEEVAA